jgi:protein-S-isoprenylcysteine O-methyltransferase Ste14
MVALRLLLPLVRLIHPPYIYLGILPLLVGVLVNIWCSSMFEREKTTVKPFQEPSRLIVAGPYRFSRHPMYLGMVLALAGLAILLGTLLAMLVAPVFAWLMESRFIGAEEKSMEETFGDAYLEYKARVRRWI